MAETWIHASEAYERVRAHVPYRAAEAICERAHDGMIAARAERLVLGQKVVEPADVPTDFWWGRGKGALSAKWSVGDFETWIDGRIHCRAYGVEFSLKDIERMLPRPRRLAFDRAEHNNFASAARCRQELVQSLQVDGEAAERLILRFTRAGLIDARCAKIWWSQTDRFGTEDFDDTNVSVPDWVWDNCLDGDDAVLDWSHSQFAGRGPANDCDVKVRLSGVEFEVAGIVKAEAAERLRLDGLPKPGSVEEPVEPQSERGSPGRRLSRLWPGWVAALVAYVHERGIPEGVGSQGQEELIKGVAEALAIAGHDAPSRSSVQPVIQAVLDRLRAANN